jgi:5'-phosphate synthase pdxT subunit
MSKSIVIGVLALQGAFAKHIAILKKIGVEAREVRKPQDLNDCDGLVIPGGESTTILRQMGFIKMQESLHEFMEKKAIFGTCAGLILLSKKVIGSHIKPLGMIDIAVERNAFGRQAESFKTNLDLHLGKEKTGPFAAIFIRAPRIRECGENVEVLAEYEGEPVLVQQGYCLGATFHPELTEDPSIHHHFVNMVKMNKKSLKTS